MLKNYMEDVVAAVYNDYIKGKPEICACEQCGSDVMALALTKLRGLYAGSLQGEVLTKISREDRQVRADALIVIMQAVDTVTARPKH